MNTPDLVDYSSLPTEAVAPVKQAMEMVKSICETHNAVLVAIEYSDGEIPTMGEIFGTVDVVLYAKDTKQLIVVDYKFGYNPVAVEMNTQLLIYAALALGVIRKGIVDTITLCVIQPRVNEDRPSLFTLAYIELIGWVKEKLIPIYNGILDHSLDTTFVPGEEQCKWCKAKATCPTIQQEVMDALNTTPNSRGADLNLGDLLAKIHMIRDWCKTIESAALAKMEEGIPVAGYKLVRKRSNRRWKDKNRVDKWLAARKIKADQRRNWTIIGIPAAEALIKNMDLSTKLKNAFARLIEKPEGGLTYAKEADPRPTAEIETTTTEALEDDFLS